MQPNAELTPTSAPHLSATWAGHPIKIAIGSEIISVSPPPPGATLDGATFTTAYGMPMDEMGNALRLARGFRPRWLFTADFEAGEHGRFRCWQATKHDQPVSPVGWEHWIDGQWIEIVGPVDVRRWLSREAGGPVHPAGSLCEICSQFGKPGQVEPQRERRAGDYQSQPDASFMLGQHDGLDLDPAHVDHGQIVSRDLSHNSQQPRGRFHSRPRLHDKAGGIMPASTSPDCDIALEVLDSRAPPGFHLGHSHSDSPSLGSVCPPSVAEAGEPSTLPGGGPAVAEPKAKQSHGEVR